MSVICKVADSCLALKGVEVVGDPVAQGSYGDVYKDGLGGNGRRQGVMVHEESMWGLRKVKSNYHYLVSYQARRLR